MRRIFIISSVLLFLGQSSWSQENFDMWYKLSPEIRMNRENKAWEIRWRPDDHIIIPSIKQYIGKNNIGRTDIMIGANIGSFKLFNYWKLDDLGRVWSGIRFDYNTAMFNKKLLINIQERLFFGLNEKSDNHYYLIQYIRYKVSKKVQAGVLSYGKWEFDAPFNEQHWFVGPTANFGLPYNFNFHVAITKSIFFNNTYMTFIRVGYRIKLKDKGN
ncbi:MAG: hypothetical protein L3J35_09520 [Bacteroidales bacterium]|nr:hypothetical protein [Bacteroidales bacterium]